MSVPMMPAEDEPGATRGALRRARQQRRRIMAACALVVVLCLAVTVLLVGTARDRPVPDVPAGIVPPVFRSLASIRPARTHAPLSRRPPRQPGASVPDGAHP